MPVLQATAQSPARVQPHYQQPVARRTTGLLNLYLGKQMFNPLKCKGKLVLHPPSFPKSSQNAPMLGFLAPTRLTVTLRGHSLPFWELLSHLNCEVTGPGQVILKSLQCRNIRLLGPGSKLPKVMSPQHQVGITVSPMAVTF